MPDDLEDWDEDDLIVEASEPSDARPPAKIPGRRSDERHPGLVRRKIGDEGPKRRRVKTYLEVHEVAPQRATRPARRADSEDDPVTEEIWDEDPGSSDGANLTPEEREKRVIAKLKLDAERQWGARRRRTTLWWTLAGAATLVLLGVLLGRADRNRKPVTLSIPQRQDVEIDISDTAVVDLLSFGHQSLPEITALLTGAQGDPQSAAPLLAGGVFSASLMQEWRERIGPVAGIKEDGVLWMRANALNQTAYLLVRGFRNDYSKYLAYFVERDGKMRLDWKATVGYSEVLPSEIPGMPAGVPKLMRVVASPSSFNTMALPESEYACYLISHLDRESYAWAYVERDSAVHMRLLGALEAPLPKAARRRVTIVVRRGPEGSLPNQVVIDEVRGADWLSIRRGQ